MSGVLEQLEEGVQLLCVHHGDLGLTARDASDGGYLDPRAFLTNGDRPLGELDLDLTPSELGVAVHGTRLRGADVPGRDGQWLLRIAREGLDGDLELTCRELVLRLGRRARLG